MLKLCDVLLPDIEVKRLIATLMSTRDDVDNRLASRLHYAIAGSFPTFDLTSDLRDRLLGVLEEADGPLADLRGTLARDYEHRHRSDV